MNQKVIDRYVEILSEVIKRKVRVDGKNATFDKKFITNTIYNLEGNVSEKTYKNAMEFFTQTKIFEKIGNTYDAKYKIHSTLNVKVSKKEKTLLAQSRFIIAQMMMAEIYKWDDQRDICNEYNNISDRFANLITIKPQNVRDTVSTLLVHKYNEAYEGVYTYDVIQSLAQYKTPFDIKIKNKSINTTLKGVILKKIAFNTDTVTVTFNNSQFELNSLYEVKSIKVPIKKDLYDKIDEAIEYLKKIDGVEAKPLIDFLNEYKVGREIFFQSIVKGVM